MICTLLYLGAGLFFSVAASRSLMRDPDHEWKGIDNLFAVVTIVAWLPMAGYGLWMEKKR